MSANVKVLNLVNSISNRVVVVVLKFDREFNFLFQNLNHINIDKSRSEMGGVDSE
jgi:hypothetical protein